MVDRGHVWEPYSSISYAECLKQTNFRF